MLELMLPRKVLDFIDEHRAQHSRAAFVVKCVVAIMALHESGLKIEIK